MLSSFQVEGAWMVGDWEAVGQILERNEVATPELAIARVLVSLQSADDALPAALRAARLELGRPLTAAGRDSYQRFYDSVVQLHLLHELETIARSGRVEIVGLNRDVLGRQEVSKMKVMLGDRLERTMPSFRVQEPILSMRRTALNLWSVNHSFPFNRISDLPLTHFSVLSFLLQQQPSRRQSCRDWPGVAAELKDCAQGRARSDSLLCRPPGRTEFDPVRVRSRG